MKTSASEVCSWSEPRCTVVAQLGRCRKRPLIVKLHLWLHACHTLMFTLLVGARLETRTCQHLTITVLALFFPRRCICLIIVASSAPCSLAHPARPEMQSTLIHLLPSDVSISHALAVIRDPSYIYPTPRAFLFPLFTKKRWGIL